MIYEAKVLSRDGEEFRSFPTLTDAIAWCLDQRPFGYKRGWVEKIEIDMATGRIERPERVNEKVLRQFDTAWREMRRAA